MTDRELLVLAAKAAGIVGTWELDKNFMHERWYFNVPYDNHGMLSGFEWNPLTDDGDALRLAGKLDMNIIHGWNIFPENIALATIHAQTNEVNVFEPKENDLCGATRRAIVRAAAEIGKTMP